MTVKEDKKITLKIEMTEQELWEAVFGSSPFSFGSWWKSAEYVGNAQWDVVGMVEVSIEDPKGNIIHKALDVHDLAKALPIANKLVWMDLFNFDNYDCICSDAILQVAVLGEVVYG